MKIWAFAFLVFWIACWDFVGATMGQSEHPDAAAQDQGRHLAPTGRISGGPIRASKLLGSEVKDSIGNRVGYLQELTLDESGKADLAVIALRNPAGAGSTNRLSAGADRAQTNSAMGGMSDMTGSTTSIGPLVPIPWSLFQVRPSAAGGAADSYMLTLNVEWRRLAHAPTLAPDHWADLNQPGLRQRIDSYYGITPAPTGPGARPDRK